MNGEKVVFDDSIVIDAPFGEWMRRTEKPVTHIRYVLRDGVPVLQYPVQWWEGLDCGVEWRDVPVADETP